MLCNNHISILSQHYRFKSLNIPVHRIVVIVGLVVVAEAVAVVVGVVVVVLVMFRTRNMNMMNRTRLSIRNVITEVKLTWWCHPTAWWSLLRCCFLW